MQWWCAAQTAAWDWRWQAYPGVWLFVAALAAAYARTAGRGASAADRAWFGAGLLLLWAGLDWPLGPLGAGYLALAHVGQYLLIGLGAPALMLLGIPRAYAERLLAGRAGNVVRELTHPVVAFLLFNLVMTVTHWPAVSDAMMATQAGAFVVDVSWLLAGLLFWWPVIVPVPARPRFGPLLQGVYLALNGLFLHPPAAIMLFSEHPVYATYELAPPVGGIATIDDQQSAGGLMKGGMAWIMALGIAGVVWRWHRRRAASAHDPALTAGTM